MSFPSLLFFPFWLLVSVFASRRIIQHVLWSRRTKQKLTHSSTKFTHSTLGENAKTSGPTEQQQHNRKKAGSCLCETSELSRRDENRKEKAYKQNQLVLHRRTLYTLLYMLTQWISFIIIFFCPFSIKTHTDVHYKKVFLFAKEQCFPFVGVMRTDAVMYTLFTYTTV